MKKLYMALFTLIVSLLALTVCNREKEDNSMLALLGLSGGPNFIKTVALSNPTSSILGPFNGEEFRHYQFLYLPADIAGSGNIASIYFRYYENSQALSCPRVTIRLGHSSVPALNTDMTSNVNQGKGSAVTVLDRAVSIPAGAAGEYFEIPLDTRFNYNGVDNLVVDITRTSACTGGVRLTTGAGAVPYTGRVYSTSSATPDTATQTSQSPHHVKFKFAGGTNNVICSDKTGPNGLTLAPGTTGRTQMLILASDINGSGLITGLALHPYSVTALTVVSNMTVSVAHVPVSTTGLVTTFTDNYGDNAPVIVAQDIAYTVPAEQPSTVWIPFNKSRFFYDGTSNLLIDITCIVDSGSYLLQYNNIIPYRVVSSTNPLSPTGTIRQRAFEPVLRFAGGTMDVITASGSSTSMPFSTNAEGRLTLYRATELGSAGTITSIACRLNSPSSTATTYNNYRVIIGHSSADPLVADPAAGNFNDQLIALNGFFSMPAGLVQGDWIEIPLTQPFIYNGTSNLAVWLGTTATTFPAIPSHSCIVSSSNATRYPGQMAAGVPGNATVGTPQDYKFNMKFKISR